MNQDDLFKWIALISGLVIVNKTARGLSSLFTPGGNVPEQFQPYLSDIYSDHVELIKNLNINRDNLTLSRQQYKTLAKWMFDRMNGPNLYNFKDIYEAIENLNKDDLKVLFMDFGLRAPVIIGTNIGYGSRKNLIEWYDDEFSGTNRKKILNSFSRSGINPPIT